MRTAIILGFAAAAFFIGCGGPDTPKVPVEPKWKGAPYRLELDTAATKPNPAGVTIPTIKYTANPEDIQKRFVFAVRFDGADAPKTAPVGNRMLMAAEDISGTEGTLPADDVKTADQELADFLGSYCVSGKVKISVALVRSSINPHAENTELEAKRLSDWMPVDVVFKNPHPRCK